MFTPEAPSPLLAVRGLSKRFGERMVMQDLNLEVMAGELVALTGPNGSGKSTALRLFAGLLQATSGSGSILGSRLGAHRRATRNAIGYLPQRAALYPRLSAHENVRLRAALAGLARPAVAAQRALQRIGLERRQGERLGAFSGGWIRRIEIAATLVHAPRLLLLDEPTTGLDAEANVQIWQTLAAFADRGGAVVFSSHDSAQLANAQRIVDLAGHAHA